MYAKAWILFRQRIQSKTSWGKTELERLMLDCLLEAESVQQEAEPPQKPIPRSLEWPYGIEEDEHIAYGIGIEDPPGEYGMLDGPTLHIDDLLAGPPPPCDLDAPIYILKLTRTDHKELFRWSPKFEMWHHVSRYALEDPNAAR